MRSMRTTCMSRIVMAMSGGVDSSVAAALLVRAGHKVIGVFMRHGEKEPACEGSGFGEQRSAGTATLPIVETRLDHKQGCCTAADAEDARRVAARLEIPFYALDLSEDFSRIIDYFVDEYTAARTPNPCVVCNNWLKFGKLFEYADGVGAEFIATGHYARAAPVGNALRGVPALLRGLDDRKDQSYVLFGVSRDYLPRMMLPLGGYRKPQIREMARELNLRVAQKRDSQEICFVSSGDHADFVRRRRAIRDREDNDTSGEIALADGTVVGRHSGIEAFTIGQRKGLRVAMGEPYYVTQIDAGARRVVIGPREELARSELTANRANWLVDPPVKAFRAEAQIRYNSAAAPALVTPLDDGRFRVDFDEPRFGVAPGQAAVCYEGPRVLGGGWIE
jgi:tRNA-uridine 2-sulfurtransferase